MIKSIGKTILRNKLGQKIFNKFYFLSTEMGILHPDFDDEFKSLREKCLGYTMTTVENLNHVHRVTKHIINNNIPGDFVECGVWKGGNLMMVALTLMNLGNTDRKIYLYDTFEGMSKPTGKDSNYKGEEADNTWEKSQKDNYNDWCYSSLDEVKENLYSTGYPKNKLIFVKGKVEDTIPNTMPKEISLLRLDTDWFESTYHELRYLYPLLTNKGFLVIDDYGYWKGAREAVDQYFKENQVKMFLNRIDYTARGGTKL